MLIRRRPRRTPRMPKPPRVIPLEQRYMANLSLLLDRFRQIVWAGLDPVLPRVTDNSKLDDDADLINLAFQHIKDSVHNQIKPADTKTIAEAAAMAINKANQDYYGELLNRVLGVNPIMMEPWLEPEVKLFVAQNSSLIQSLPTEGLADIEQLVFRESQRGLSPQQMRAKINEQFDVTENRARLIARDQVGKFNGQLTKLRQENLGIDEYTWRTSEDGRVRSFSNSDGYSDHKHLDGKIFKWSDPPVTVFKGKRAGERNHPGQDIQCRCHAEPVLKKFFKK